MAKYKDGNFAQLNRDIFKDNRFRNLSMPAKILYFYLIELEHRYTNTNTNWFFASDRDLEQFTGLTRKTIGKAKRELANQQFIKLSFCKITHNNGTKHIHPTSKYELLR